VLSFNLSAPLEAGIDVFEVLEDAIEEKAES
jgi:hypothetical protein